RPLRLEPDELVALRVPCILHWDLNHFVVLTRTAKGEIWITDPAVGERRLSLAEAGRHFTGVALELQPGASFEPQRKKPTLSLGALLGGQRGLRSSLVQVFVLAVSLETVVLVTPFFMQWVVDGAIVSGDRDLLLLLALGFGLLLLIQVAIACARSLVILHASIHLSLHWNASLFAHLLHLPVAWFERRQVGDVVSRFGSVATLQRTLTTSFIEALLDGLMATATLALMLVYSQALALIAVAAALLYALIRWAAYRPLRLATEEQVVLAARAESLFIESVRAVASIKMFNHEDARQARWMNATVDADNRMAVAERMTIAVRSTQSLLAGGEHLLIVYLGAAAVIDGLFSVGVLLAFVAYRAAFASRVGALVDKWIQLRMLDLHRARLADIALEPREDAAAGRSSGRDDLDWTIEAVGVSFRYGDDEPWVLKDVHLRIPAGACVAITGASGCGKTTLLKILMGLLPPTEGEVRIGGMPVAQIGVQEYRRRLGAVLQDDQLLAGSIEANIAYFEHGADRSRVEACARAAAIHDEIVALPMRYETLVGDMGSSLSGGQKQRVLLARALYKQPAVLFLDEATSHLDLRREGLINDSVRTLRFTRVLVAHRPQTIASADRVVVLDGGAIRQDLRVPTFLAGSSARSSGE
ncbi:MAG TPA: peptidase domain-containing ABC transporter, partial [Burkholderiaceae bacterium]|nr:peptidase domain-containing ABC transporter [Burkholderiaceae bacterium]